MKRKQFFWQKTIVMILITVATCLLIVPFIQNYYALRVLNNKSVHYRDELPIKRPFPETIHGFSLRNILDIEGHNYNAVGRVLVPSIGLSDNIYVGITNGNLGIGAVTMFPDRIPEKHNVVLLGHNVGYTAIHFGVLSNAKIKDKIYLKYLNHYYEYLIYSIETIDEKEVQKVKDTSDSQLSMLTCSKSTRTPKRILVKAKMVKTLNTSSDKKNMIKIEKSTIKKNTKNLRNKIWSSVCLPILSIIACYTIIIVLVLKKLND